MPSRRPPSQPDGQPPGWLQREPGRQMLADVQRAAIPELTRVFGQHGLYMRPSAGLPVDLSGNMLANVVSVHRHGDALAGQMRCRDAELPISAASLSLVYVLFVLETSPEPRALLQEIARSLKPGGVVLLIGLNPWSPARLRWSAEPMRLTSNSLLERLAQDAGLEVVRRHHLGPFWPSATSLSSDPGGNRWLDAGLRWESRLGRRSQDRGQDGMRPRGSRASSRG